MEKLKKTQKVYRTAFTKQVTAVDGCFKETEIQRERVIISFQLLENKMAEMNDVQAKIIDAMMSDKETTEEEIQKEMTTADDYQAKFLQLKFKVRDFVEPPTNTGADNSINSENSTLSHRLPKLEIPKFSGNTRDWLTFWSQFKKVHVDSRITSEDKFQYLLQAVESGTRAYDLVHSFPPSGDNYAKVIKSLEERFGRSDLLIEVYVRELLELVLRNVMKKNEKIGLASLYDQLETQMRALETLGVTAKNCAAMLFPLVESALPEEVLRTWQRSSMCEAGKVAEADARLSTLMKFLQAEVQNEERVSMAMQGFDLSTKENKGAKIKPRNEAKKEVATAAGLLSVNANKNAKCIFCQSQHESSECDSARKMTVEKRRKFAKENNCCYNCLKKGHTYNRCRLNLKCAWCGNKHVLIMCPEMQKPLESEKSDEGPNKAKTVTEHNLASVQDVPTVYLQTFLVRAFNDESEVTARAIIDTGSQRSYVTDALAKKLGYQPVATQEITHSLFGGSKTASKMHDIFLVRLKKLDGSYACNFRVTSESIICGDIATVQPAPWLDILKEKNVVLTDVQSNRKDIDILIGADVAGKLYTGSRYALANGLTAIETLLGWTVMGEPKRSESKENSALLATSLFLTQADITDLWKLDTLGIADPISKKSEAAHNLEVKEKFLDTVTINEEERYEVQLPWIEDHPPLPSNESFARKRSQNTINTLKNSNNIDEYFQVFQQWESLGIVEKVPEEELDNPSHYLPHRPIYKEGSSTPIRPVFDPSTQEKGKKERAPTLNQCLNKGPNLIEQLQAILLAFRRGKIGVISDIEKAFLQISVAPKDRDNLRFVIFNGKVTETWRHCRVVFGLNCSPFILAAVIEMHIQRAQEGELTRKYLPWIVEKLKKSFYVDNCVCSVETEQELKEFITQATSIMDEGRFNLRGWEYSGDSNPKKTMVLGMIWDKSDDTLSLNLCFLDEQKPMTATKRSILSAAHRIFDPLGIACPVTIRPKLLLQRAWLLNLGWDTKLDDGLTTEFFAWLKGLPLLKEVKIPRMMGCTETTETSSLHTFCDASGYAYAAVVFLRSERADKVQVQLLAAKARVAPLRGMTIPRLELLAATIGARLAASVATDIGCNKLKVHFWTDSTTVLSWIKRDAPWNTFVWNRVQEIRRLSSSEDWRHVPGEHNPADLPSRGCSAKQLISSRWWEGPSWLKEERSWPTTEYTTDEDIINAEQKKTAVVAIVKCNSTSESDTLESRIVNYFSSFLRIVRMIAWMRRFMFNCRNACKVRKRGELGCDEIVNAEIVLLRITQRDKFKVENDDKLKTFETFRDKNGLIRIKTKIFNREDTPEFRAPIILDSKNLIVKRLVEYEHKKQHAGAQALISQLRERYWIIAARRLVRTVIDNCIVCKRYRVKRLETRPAPLPIDRVRDAAVFEVTGVDFAGPLYLRGGEKVWVSLFTCAIYRAVHLELVGSLSTSAFVEALRRFIARRGRPSTIYSDNGTNFVGFKNLSNKLDWNAIAEYSSSRKIEWRFNPPSAAWWGGWWERIVRSVKQVLRRVLGKASVTYEEMSTILCDCEALINSRPLSALSEDPLDLKPLTPAMFLHDELGEGVPDCDLIETSNLKACLRYRQKLKDDLRKRFRTEYLGHLKGATIMKENREINVGDLVLIGDDIHKRLDWPLGIVTSVIPGRDGVVRTLKIKTQKTELTRPIQRVYPLELSCSGGEAHAALLKDIDTSKIEIIKNKRDAVPVKQSKRPLIVNDRYKTRSGRYLKGGRMLYLGDIWREPARETSVATDVARRSSVERFRFL